MKGFVCSLAIAIVFTTPLMASAEVQTEEVSYTGDGLTFKGYLAYDDSLKGRRPGVLVVHEWWGLNDYARKRAEDLARLGYTALAIDMYGDGAVAEHPKDATAFSSAVKEDLEGARRRFSSGMTKLKDHPTVDPGKVAAIGYCFGGGIVLHMARVGFPLNAVVSFHGSLAPLAEDAKAKEGEVPAKVLVCHGAADSFIPEEDIKNFKEEMEAADVDYIFKSYPDAKHSFTNPGADAAAEKFGIGVGYNKAADEQSWQDMKDFLEQVFVGVP